MDQNKLSAKEVDILQSTSVEQFVHKAQLSRKLEGKKYKEPVFKSSEKQIRGK